MIRVKICGITNVEDALFCVEQGADALGFIFTKISPRRVRWNQAKKIISVLPPFVSKTGVFVNEKKDFVFQQASNLGLDVLQFHGNESAGYCRFFRPKFKVIKVLFPEDRPFRKKISRYRGAVDAFLFDIKYSDKTEGVKSLSSQIISEISGLIKEGVCVIFSAGLNSGSFSMIKKLKPYAVDVASGVEKAVGIKDKKLTQEFIKLVNVLS